MRVDLQLNTPTQNPGEMEQRKEVDKRLHPTHALRTQTTPTQLDHIHPTTIHLFAYLLWLRTWSQLSMAMSTKRTLSSCRDANVHGRSCGSDLPVSVVWGGVCVICRFILCRVQQRTTVTTTDSTIQSQAQADFNSNKWKSWTNCPLPSDGQWHGSTPSSTDCPHPLFG